MSKDYMVIAKGRVFGTYYEEEAAEAVAKELIHFNYPRAVVSVVRIQSQWQRPPKKQHRL